MLPDGWVAIISNGRGRVDGLVEVQCNSGARHREHPLGCVAIHRWIASSPKGSSQ